MSNTGALSMHDIQLPPRLVLKEPQNVNDYCASQMSKISTNQTQLIVKNLVAERLPKPEVRDASSADKFPLALDATQCPDCIGNKEISERKRTFQFCRTTARNDQFDNMHLPQRESVERSGGLIECKHPKCEG